MSYFHKQMHWANCMLLFDVMRGQAYVGFERWLVAGVARGVLQQGLGHELVEFAVDLGRDEGEAADEAEGA